jgi:hypothetical protein
MRATWHAQLILLDLFFLIIFQSEETHMSCCSATVKIGLYARVLRIPKCFLCVPHTAGVHVHLS